MERITAFISLAMFMLAGVGGALRFRELHVDWQFNAIVIVVALPAVFALVDACRGRDRLANALQPVAVALIIVAAVTWARLNWHATWLIAGAGLIVFAVLTTIFSGRFTQADGALQRAAAALNTDTPNLREALTALNEAQAKLGMEASMLRRALFEYLSAAAHGRLGNLSRGSTHASEALALYRMLKRTADAKTVENLARQLNLEITFLPLGGSFATQTRNYSIRLGVFAVLAVAAMLFLFRMWAAPVAQVTIPALLSIGVALAIWFLALPWFISRQSGAAVGPLVFSIAIAGVWLGTAAIVLRSGLFRTADVGPLLQVVAGHFRNWLSGFPAWMPWSALVLFVALAAVSLLYGKESAIKVLARAKPELAAQRWDRATAILERIDFKQEGNLDVKGQALFLLAFACRMSNNPARANELLDTLLETSPAHRHGLYLAAYLALEAGKLARAENLWNRLCAIDATFNPLPTEPNRSARYCLAATLYRKGAQLKDQPEMEAETLAQISQTGAMDKTLAKSLVEAHCSRGVEFLRRKQWQSALHEFELADQKCGLFDKVETDNKETRKLRAFCEAGAGLVRFKKGDYSAAVKAFRQAREFVADLICQDRVIGGEGDLLVQLLRAAQRKPADANLVVRAFVRDVSFMAGIAQLNALRRNLEQDRKSDWSSALAVAQRFFEESLESAPSFAEGAAMLGLIYCHSGAAADRAKGVELLKKIHERMNAKFILETLEEVETAEQKRAEAQEACLQMFLHYLHSSHIPHSERQRLHDEVIGRMKEMGQEKAFMGRGGLEIEEDWEHEPTLNECITRAAMLREKLLQASQNHQNDEVIKLVEELEGRARSFLETQKEMMKKAQALLSN